MASLTDLTDIVGKLRTDVSARMQADAGTIATLTTAGALKDATIADLQTQLAAFQNDATVIDAAVQTLTELDDSVTVPTPAA